jgi:hypothetical protein
MVWSDGRPLEVSLVAAECGGCAVGVEEGNMVR